LVFLFLFFAHITGVPGQAALFQAPSVKATQSKGPVDPQLQKRLVPGRIIRPPPNLPTRDQPQDPDNPRRIPRPPGLELPLVTVPDLVGRTKDDAVRLIRRAHLNLGGIREMESAEPVDQVVRQSLKPDTRVLIGSVIDIVVAQPRQTTVPRLIGRPEREALRAILGAQLKLGNIAQEESAAPADEVIRQSLRPGSRVPVGQVIDIVIARQETTVVPNLIRSSKDQASSLIADARLRLGNVRQEESAAPADQVIRQSLRPGSRVPLGQVIDIVVAQQETTVVPNLMRTSKDQASSLIADARLRLGSVRQEESAAPADQVIRQSLRPGSRVPVGQVIDIVIAQQETTVVPNLMRTSKDQASSLIANARLKLGSVRQEESAAAADQVIRQSLAPGSRVPVGQAIDIVVAQLGTTIVPGLSGLQLEEVFRKIAAAKLQLGNVTRERTMESNEGVLRQTPDPGSRVQINTKVDLVIATAVARVKVPDLVGKLKDQAADLLTGAGLRPGTIREKAAARPRGEVLAQTPAAGVEAPLGTLVEFSTSAPLEVPNIVGVGREEATARLNQAGFTIGAITERFAVFRATGKVFSQVPAAGTLLAAPQSVNLVVSTGVPTWAAATLLLLAGSAAGFLIRGRTHTPRPRTPPEQQPALNWSTRVHRDLGSQQVEHGAQPVGADIRVRPIVDCGTQSIRETPSQAVRSVDAA
jgi:beta-lactam-binding protein with PASTA domain